MPITTHSPEEFRFRLAETLRRERLEHGYETIYELADAMGVPVRALMNLETGNMGHIGALFGLARFYGKRVRVDFI